MRVAIDARDAAAPQTGGWGRYARCLIEALRGVEGLELILYERAPRLPELVFEQLILPRRLRRDRPDAVHSPNCFLPLNRPCAGVVTVHDLAFEAYPGDFAPRTGWKYRTFARRAVASAERVIVPSEATRADLVERYGAEESKIRVIPEASTLPPPAAGGGGREAPPTAPGEAPADPYVLCVGDLRAKKNAERLVAAHALARERGLRQRLVIAGRGSLPAAEGVELLGFVSEGRLDRLYRGADLLVYPSLYEGFGLAALEAMERGCPVALARATSLPEVGGEAAIYFDPQSVEEIAVALLRLGGDPELRRRLAAAGRERAATFSWARAAAATAEVYREAAEARA